MSNTPFHRLLPPLLGLALLAGCTTLSKGGPAAPPAAPTPLAATPPVAWQAPLPHGGQTTDLAQWWSQFKDPALTALIDDANRASPTLAAARTRIERARAARTAADAGAWPGVSAVASGATGRSVPGAPTATSLSLGAQAAWELDLFGAVAAGRSAAQARLEGAQAGWHDARVAVAAEVASSYTLLRACEAQVEQARLDSTSRAETARLTSQSAQAGFTAPADAALARAGAAQARGQLLQQQAQCDTLVKSLVELTDTAEPDLRSRLAPGRAQLPQAAPIAVTAVPAAWLAQRPDLAEAERAVVAAAADQRQSRAREGLQVSLSGSIGVGSMRSMGVSTNGSTWQLGPLVVSFPVFDGGARAANTVAAQAAYEEALVQYRAQMRRAVREVEAALVALDSTAQREVDARAAARDFEASLVATQARQKGGLASLFDLEAARRNAVQAQSALIELQRERVAAWIALYRALGGGWNATQPLTPPLTAQAQP